MSEIKLIPPPSKEGFKRFASWSIMEKKVMKNL